MSAQAKVVDISLFPGAVSPPGAEACFAIGDLHGNAFKLIHFLVKTGVMVLDEANYHHLLAIYETPLPVLSKEHLALFSKILAEAKIQLPKKITLIGDELSDRGMNDYYTLKVLEKLKEEGVSLDITLSNHSIIAWQRFMEVQVALDKLATAEEKRAFLVEYRPALTMGDKDSIYFERSLHNYFTLIQYGLVDETEFRRLANEVYLPSLKLIDYRIDEKTGELTLFTHAPIGLKDIARIADALGLAFDDTSLDVLTNSIEMINQRILEKLTDGSLTAFHDVDKGIDEVSPLTQFIWGRQLSKDFTLTTSGGIEINHRFGHMGPLVMLERTHFAKIDGYSTTDKHISFSTGTYEKMIAKLLISPVISREMLMVLVEKYNDKADFLAELNSILEEPRLIDLQELQMVMQAYGVENEAVSERLKGHPMQVTWQQLITANWVSLDACQSLNRMQCLDSMHGKAAYTGEDHGHIGLFLVDATHPLPETEDELTPHLEGIMTRVADNQHRLRHAALARVLPDKRHLPMAALAEPDVAFLSEIDSLLQEAHEPDEDKALAVRRRASKSDGGGEHSFWASPDEAESKEDEETKTAEDSPRLKS